jgi:hypothetical protein
MAFLRDLKFAFQYLTGLGIRPCEHSDTVRYTQPSQAACQRCTEGGTAWAALRMCTYCGQTFCSDSSEEKHAEKHVEATGHPITISIEPGESWQWCYPHNRLVARKTVEAITG